jgi:hypothetical protein
MLGAGQYFIETTHYISLLVTFAVQWTRTAVASADGKPYVGLVNIRISEGHAPLPLTTEVEPSSIFTASKYSVKWPRTTRLHFLATRKLVALAV